MHFVLICLQHFEIDTHFEHSGALLCCYLTLKITKLTFIFGAFEDIWLKCWYRYSFWCIFLPIRWISYSALDSIKVSKLSRQNTYRYWWFMTLWTICCIYYWQNSTSFESSDPIAGFETVGRPGECSQVTLIMCEGQSITMCAFVIVHHTCSLCCHCSVETSANASSKTI